MVDSLRARHHHIVLVSSSQALTTGDYYRPLLRWHDQVLATASCVGYSFCEQVWGLFAPGQIGANIGHRTTMYRWTARLLLLVVTLPAFGPMAMARLSPATGAHCLRQPAKPTVMPCHHDMTAMAGSAPAAWLRAAENCCENHDCCIRGVTTRQWARPESARLSQFRLRADIAPAVSAATLISTNGFRQDSARAPPRAS
jgi:hypothetical protein